MSVVLKFVGTSYHLICFFFRASLSFPRSRRGQQRGQARPPEVDNSEHPLPPLHGRRDRRRRARQQPGHRHGRGPPADRLRVVHDFALLTLGGVETGHQVHNLTCDHLDGR